MEITEFCWELVSNIYVVFRDGVIPGCFLWRFAGPFVKREQAAKWTGVVYAAVMLFLYYQPVNISSFLAHAAGAAVAFAAMGVMDYRNLEQKLVLSVIFFLVDRAAVGVSVFIANFFVDFLIYFPPIAEADIVWQFVVYILTTLLRLGSDTVFLWIAFSLVLKEYGDKEENLEKKELLLLFIPFLPVIAGYYGISLLTEVYEADTGNAVWYEYGVYNWLRAGYDIVSFGAVFVMVLVYQSIKKGQAEKRQTEFLHGQVESMECHIREVERLYGSIRSLKHDMGNHIMTLERLYAEREYKEAGEYAVKLQKEFQQADWEVKSGNPVTDVVLSEKKREAEEKGIAFISDFHFPEGTDINAFDMSVILNNAVTNAIEAAQQAKLPYIHLASGRRKNAYMIEIKNSFCGSLPKRMENGLFYTTKEDKQMHGFGLANIQKIAQKYLGEIDIRQEDGFFVLNIMLLLHISDQK